MKPLLLVALLLLPISASAQTATDRVHTASEWAVFAAHMFDGMATQRVIGEQKGHEVSWALLRSTDPLEMAAMKTGGAVGTVWLTRKIKRAGHPVWSIVTNAAVSSALFTIAANNERVRRNATP